ncbi:TPA: hypothetical protein N0F65_010821 [Lagenidium giganteum]|uniref:Peptidase M13 C-terminal domain-containing protein n=1 Tax=Lagenidium giganteum TaxID=4803 RepID=A0AAV2Z741_9STRA|nr:TPA: hypothetical protein N0F65_010821 [Lagenidium giganteum]
MEKRVHEVEWLGNTTREAAIKKVKATAKLVGASDVTEDFNFLENSTLLSNVEKALRLTTERNLQLAGKPVDRFQWRTTAATVNAHHVPFLNQVAIPVGFLQSPVFNMTYHPVRNFGVLGTSIGHEITHGYDSKGRFYDENGSIHLWWTDADDAEFVRRSQCFIDQYSSLELTDDEGQYVINNNCTTTLGENIADNVGLKLAHEGYKAFAEKNPDQHDEVERLFFISFGQMLCHVAKADYIKEAVLKHHHSAPQARINGMMMNSKAFAEAFQCPVESAMNPEIKCEIW